jgi:hypothetical protein
MLERGHGFLKAALSLNGNHLAQILFYGYMENVSVSDAHSFIEADIRFVAGSGKSVLW